MTMSTAAPAARSAWVSPRLTHAEMSSSDSSVRSAMDGLASFCAITGGHSALFDIDSTFGAYG